jgi:hypothetical protein
MFALVDPPMFVPLLFFLKITTINQRNCSLNIHLLHVAALMSTRKSLYISIWIYMVFPPFDHHPSASPISSLSLLIALFGTHIELSLGHPVPRQSFTHHLPQVNLHLTCSSCCLNIHSHCWIIIINFSSSKFLARLLKS